MKSFWSVNANSEARQTGSSPCTGLLVLSVRQNTALLATYSLSPGRADVPLPDLEISVRLSCRISNPFYTLLNGSMVRYPSYRAMDVDPLSAIRGALFKQFTSRRCHSEYYKPSLAGGPT
jgi:hypothetical protein